MTFKTLMIASVSSLALVAGTAQADDRLALDQLDNLLERGQTFGFTHYEEIEVDSQDVAEIEGWLDDEWYADVRLSLNSDETLREERERLVSGAWGMTAEDVRQAFSAASAEGMTEFESVQINEAGRIEIEGRGQNGRELEITTRQGEDGVLSVEQD
ncbi:PepSY domain-containing protein [Halomonas sabkhae]|uniref:PepSY domain-containing protein n=1 Tax=Halomonas sabkhae TaxID=626223 RepID=UPI0025B2BDEF|nr:PepSY domain-containing protein [Halomonas sabkhae]MDN3525904.1 PepSY domain-containing protein [Halomonas sabkhae]